LPNFHKLLFLLSKWIFEKIKIKIIQHPSAKPEPGKAKEEELWKTQNIISPCKNITFNKIHQKKPK
jgi:hypothetical protein